MVVIIAVVVIAGVLAHLVFTGIAAGGLGTTIHDLRSPTTRAGAARVRVRDLGAGARIAIYGMLGFWLLVALGVLVVGLTR